MKPLSIDISEDGHIHTYLCSHATGTMEEYVLAGIKQDLKKIYFLEHLETGIGYFETTWLSDEEFDLYFQEGERLQKKYSENIEIGLGVEVGYNPKKVADILDKLHSRSYDRVGLSYHFLDTSSGHLNMVSRKQVNIDALGDYGIDQVIERYYQDLIEAIHIIPADVLCHFDAALRYHPEVHSIDSHNKLIEALLDAVVESKMAIEVNTSGYKIRNEPYPSLELLKIVVASDIPLIAGSDAHHPQEVGRHFDKLKNITL